VSAGAEGAAEAVGLRGRGGRGARGPRGVVVLVCVVLPAALVATAVAVPAALWSRLPARIADHWTAAGTANGEAPRLVPFLLLGAIVLAGAVMVGAGLAAALSGRSGRSGRPQGPGRAGRPMAGGGTGVLIQPGLFLMSVGTSAVIVVTVANLGGADRSASIGPGGLLATVGCPLALAGFASYLLRRYGGLGAAVPAFDRNTRPTIGLRAGERAVWTGRARAAWAGPGGALLLAAGVVTAIMTRQWGIAVPLSVAGVALLAFTSVRVRVAARGVSVGYGPLGLRLTRIPLRRIVAAEAVDRTSSNSFGYRGSLLVFGAAAVIVRRGPALKLTLRDGKTFLVTVDDAATGAALLNDLLKAETAAGGGSGD
jgi:hypothetical protein